MKYCVFYLSFFLVVMSCSQVQRVTDRITKPTAREVYERTLKDSDSLTNLWTASYTNAKQTVLELNLPAVIASQSQRNTSKALGYSITLKRGEMLNVLVDSSIDTSMVCIDVFKVEKDSIGSDRPLISNMPHINTISYEIERTGLYKIIIQPEMEMAFSFQTRLYTTPTFHFPVSGATNAAIGSFWGAQRDGGKRSHKGIDIFAKRGTPIVAATKGYISSTGNRGLGGKQVWLRDGLFGQSLYYAHLDSIATTRGMKVEIGDTLGFVGNTGNAKTTSPHLHFGIYTSSGAIDPLPFVKQKTVPDLVDALGFSKGSTKLRQNQLRLGPSTDYDKLATLSDNQDVGILGKSEQWYHIIVADSLEGFMHQSLIKPSVEKMDRSVQLTY